MLALFGCTGQGNPPTALVAITAKPFETVTSTPLGQATATSVPATATPTQPAGLIARIQSVALSRYLVEVAAKVQLGDTAETDPTSQWIVEDYQGSKRFRNVATSHYISIEHLQPYVEALDIYPVWMSPRWTFDSDPAKGPTLLRNVWHNWEVLYVDEASSDVKYGRPPANTKAAQWILTSIGGQGLAAPTPTAVVAIPTASNPAGSRGAAVPWLEYEAEDGQFSGKLLGPDRTFGTIPAEASGRQAVQLNAQGDYVQFKSQRVANSIVVRYVIPDAPNGGGISATLSLYVNNVFQQKLNLTSKYAWSYGGESVAFNAPSTGAHHFFDEARALVKDIPAGAMVKLQKDADDTADYYVVDLVDLEAVPPPLTEPDGFLSITTDCGAVANDGQDDGPAIQKCIQQAQQQGKGVWIPEGIFKSTSVPFEVSDVTIRGAGMWYSTLQGFYARFNCNGDNCRYYDFAILGETIDRNDDSPENGFNNGAGTGSVLENIWVEHTKVGYWVGPGLTNGLIIRNSRFRDLFADGVNFASGTSNSLVENSHFRNTGDDALASWSLQQGQIVNTNNVFRFNTVQLPWRANCFAIYGGQDNKVEDNQCYDTVTYPGIYIAQSFNSAPFAGVTSVQRNSLIRAGGPMYHQEYGALKIRAEQGPIAGELIIKDLLIEAPTFAGLEIEGNYPVQAATFENIQIQGAGTQGILIRSSASGQATFKEVAVSDSAKEALLNYAPDRFFKLVKDNSNSGW